MIVPVILDDRPLPHFLKRWWSFRLPRAEYRKLASRLVEQIVRGKPKRKRGSSSEPRDHFRRIADAIKSMQAGSGGQP